MTLEYTWTIHGTTHAVTLNELDPAHIGRQNMARKKAVETNELQRFMIEQYAVPILSLFQSGIRERQRPDKV